MQLFEDSSKLVIRLSLINSGTDLVADKRERVLSEEYPGKHQSTWPITAPEYSTRSS